jgi:cysteinyl-tRNA synthetase
MLKSKGEYRSSRPVTVYSSLGGIKLPLDPIDRSEINTKVKMYVCGLTPQDHAHMGHGLKGVRFDIIRRYLSYRNLDVTFVENVTDVEDKIIAKAVSSGEDPMEMTRRHTDEFYRCMGLLNVLPVSEMPKVTEYIPEIISFVEKLIAKGFAYAAPDGSVYFSVKKKSDYGKLSNQNIEMLYESVRKEIDKQKDSPLDFALWKRDESRILTWDSPWGRGRPGWHIECSVMILETLGGKIDIHGGGLDLKFPHHENEIAQSEAFTGDSMANVWMHSGLLNINGQKMSKSLNNFITLGDGIDRYGSAPLRFVITRQHYRASIDLTDKLFRDNLNSLIEFHRLFDRLGVSDLSASDLDSSIQAGSSTACSELIAQFETAMDNDFNTPEAVVALEQCRNNLVAQIDAGKITVEDAAPIGWTIRGLGAVLGLFATDTAKVEDEGLRFVGRREGGVELSRADIQGLIAARSDARSSKNYAKADEIRGELAQGGVEILDSKAGTTWRFAVV